VDNTIMATKLAEAVGHGTLTSAIPSWERSFRANKRPDHGPGDCIVLAGQANEVATKGLTQQ
jgi:hypothetical protein